MKREETIIVDLKVKDYDVIKLKQLDTTKLIFKILDNSTEVNLSSITARIIFKKANGLIVIQNCEITDNLVQVVLIQDCVRASRKS